MVLEVYNRRCSKPLTPTTSQENIMLNLNNYTEQTNIFYRCMTTLAGQGLALRTTLEDIHAGACAVSTLTLDAGWESYTSIN